MIVLHFCTGSRLKFIWVTATDTEDDHYMKDERIATQGTML